MHLSLFSKVLSSTSICRKKKQNGVVQVQKEPEHEGSNKGAMVEVEDYNAISCFTQLVTAPICEDDFFHVDGLF